jgi:hypothetical protein
MEFKKVGDAILFGAAAALGSTIIALVFRTVDRRFDSHRVVLPQAGFLTLPPIVQAACLHPASCQISVVSG